MSAPVNDDYNLCHLCNLEEAHVCVNCHQAATVDRDALRKATLERDKAQVLAELGEQYRRERDEAREKLARYRKASDEVTGAVVMKLDAARKERDEARAEVERLRDENAHRREMLRRETEANERLRKENDAIAAEVERLRREVDAMAAELHALSVKKGFDS